MGFERVGAGLLSRVVAVALLGGGVSAVAAVSAAPVQAAVSCPAPFVMSGSTCTVRLTDTSRQGEITLPAEAGVVTVELAGASGGSAYRDAIDAANPAYDVPGGSGGKLRGRLLNAAGQRLIYRIGAAGVPVPDYLSPTGTGGGGSFLAFGATGVLVAAAGGGGGASYYIGQGGGDGSGTSTGGNGRGVCSVGGGAQPDRGGNGADGDEFCDAAGVKLGRDGAGPAQVRDGTILPGRGGDSDVDGGGPGGDGYYGGGGGSYGGGGGGGNGFSGGLSAPLSYESTLGGNSGAGYLVLTYEPPLQSTPSAPTTVSAVAGDSSVRVSWSAPSDDGGSPVTGYTVLGSPGGSCVVVATSCTITGLTNGTAYSFTVRPRNAVGEGATSGASSAVTPLGVWTSTPDPVIAADALPLTLAGTLRANVGAAVPAASDVRWKWQYVPDGRSAWNDVPGRSGTGVPVTPLAGTPAYLSLGQYYRLALTYLRAGYPDATVYSNVIGPVTNQYAFTAALTTSQVRAGTPVGVRISNPSTSGDNYIYSWLVDGQRVQYGSSGSYTPTRAQVGKSLAVSVFGFDIGWLAATELVTAADVIASDVPGAPSGVSAEVSADEAGSARVSWTAPADDGGSPVTGYTVTGSAGGSCTAAASATSCVVSGLEPGVAVTFSVVSSNRNGDGAASLPSGSVTPRGSWISTPPAAIATGTGAFTTGGEVNANLAAATPTASVVRWQWQRTPDGATAWSDVVGATGTTAPVVALKGDGLLPGWFYRLKVTYERAGFPDAEAFSNVVGPSLGVWTSTPDPSIYASASPLTVEGALDANLGAATPTASVVRWQWQTTPDGRSAWSDVASAGGTTTPVTSLTASNGLVAERFYRLEVTYERPGFPDAVVVSNVIGSALAEWTSTPDPVISADSSPLTVAGSLAANVGAATPGASDVRWRWQYVPDGLSAWRDVPGASGSGVPVTALSSLGDYAGQYLRLELTYVRAGYRDATTYSNVVGPVIDKPVVEAAVFTEQPADALTMDERTATFQVAVTGAPSPAVSWERSTNSGRTWAPMVPTAATGVSSDGRTLTVTGAAKLDGSLYRAVATNTAGTVRSSTARLSVTRLLRPPTVAVQRGDGQLTLTWSPSLGNRPLEPTGYVVQRVVPNASPVTVCLVPADAALRCVVGGLVNGSKYGFSVAAVNAAGAGRAAAVSGIPIRATVFTQQPESTSVAAGATFRFTAAVSGDPAPRVRWEVSSDDGATWRNANGAGATSTVYSEKALAARSGWRYRLKATQPTGAVSYSRVVTVTITR
ncbi:fibronectin type III domain-containing protein [Nocardioides sp.]|uniref:fibronectin type III domain-containing protein n=1 Tax=Nocardioides sp. TaxID=35761 RepID=UPI003515B65E